MSPIAVDHITEARLPPPDTTQLSTNEAHTQQRQYLTYLLQRALKQVPFVKLDSVEACIQLLTEAVDLLEANIDETIPAIENIDALISPPPVGLEELRFRSSRDVSGEENPVRPYDTIEQSTTHIDTIHDDNIPIGVPAKGVAAAAEDKDGSRYVANKLLGVAVTRDYSSPRSAARSLGSKDSGSSKQTKPILGLGAKSVSSPSVAAPTFSEQRSQSSGARPSSRAQGATQVANTLQQQFTHKPSSRATHATVIPNDTDSDAGSQIDTDEDIGDEIRGVARPLPNKLLSRIGGASKEFPSPKLGPRSIGSTGGRSSGGPLNAQTAPLQVTAGRSASVPQGRLGLSCNDSDVQSQPSQISPSHARPHSMSYDNDEPVVESVSPIDYTDKDEEVDDTDQYVASMTINDETHYDFTQLVKKDPVSQLKAQVPIPVTASPKQYKSSLALLDLAKKSADEQPDTGLENVILATRPLQNQQINRLTESAISAPGSPGVGPNGTPKPAWLRRLDSPLTHHGKLMQAKSQMHQLLKRAMVAATRVKSDKIPDAQDVITRALDKLEQSTTIAAAAASNLPSIPNM